MPDLRHTAFTALAQGGTDAANDLVVVTDISDTTMAASGTNKGMTIQDFFREIPAGTVGAPGGAFSTDPDTGHYRPSANVYAIAAGGVDGIRVNTVASGVNYLDITPSAAGNDVLIGVAGTDTNIDIRLVPAGTGDIFAAAGARYDTVSGDTDINANAGDVLIRRQGTIVCQTNNGNLDFVGAGNAPSIVNEAASATNPTLCPARNDLDTGVGQNAANQVSIIAGAVEAARFVTVASGVNFIELAPGASASGAEIRSEGSDANPNIELVPKGNGAVLVFSDFRADTSNSFRLENETPSSTNPVYVFNGDQDTGIGRNSADQLSIIAGGVEIARAIESAQDSFHVRVDNATVPDADVPTSFVTFYLDEAANNLVFKARYSNGTTVNTGTVALT